MPQKLGQHFLKSNSILKKIADKLDIKSGEWVVEVGPGHGELTKHLLERGEKVVVIEKDRELAERLHETFADAIKEERLIVRQGDVREVLDDVVSSISSYVLAGNIPYYLTGYLFRMLGELSNKPSRVVLVIQKEVGERLCAGAGEMDLLAASVQICAEPRIAGTINKKYFSPPPKIDSVIVLLHTRSKPLTDLTSTMLFLKILFAHRRKTIQNNLVSGGYNAQQIASNLAKYNLDPKLRPQQLSLEDIIHLAASF